MSANFTVTPAAACTASAPPVRRIPGGARALGLLALLGAGAAGWVFLRLPTPPCLFHMLSGYPCPSCGLTRMAIALFHGEWMTALRMQPLGFALLWTAVIYWLADARREWRTGAGVPLYDALFTHRRWLRWSLLGAIALNWLFLIHDKR